jgi:carbonic anhydrase
VDGSRLSDLPEIVGLPYADIDVIRTGGPAMTEDVLGEIVVSTQVLGTTEIMLLNHTGCGFTTFTDDELNEKLSASTGDASPAPMRFFSYKDPEQNTREQIKKTGLIREIQQVARNADWNRLGWSVLAQRPAVRDESRASRLSRWRTADTAH